MLKKYLPELKSLLKQQNPPNFLSETGVEPEDNLNTSPNLLFPLKKRNDNTEVFQKSLAKTFFLLSAVPLIVTAVIFTLNRVTKSQLNRAIDEKNSLAIELQNRDFEDRKAIVVIKKTELIKEAIPTDKAINTKISALVENLPSSVELVNVGVTSEKTIISTKSASALSVAQLILHYLNTGIVKEVTITSADLRSEEGVYIVNLELGY